MKVERNSFERFSDELTEQILQYLTFEDKVRLECVSKQWRRLVFNKQFVFELNTGNEESENSMNKFHRVINDKYCVRRQSLKSVLKKCPNLTKVKLGIRVNIKVLSVIGRYCPHIRSLTSIEN